ncbi:hypothetical protein NXC14_PA00432 (plasmid) [Rhizobium sp. NXC14]|nr:hypothetical protein NXC14_PA00432 [Rhizobium sp. NXC14]
MRVNQSKSVYDLLGSDLLLRTLKCENSEISDQQPSVSSETIPSAPEVILDLVCNTCLLHGSNGFVPQCFKSELTYFRTLQYRFDAPINRYLHCANIYVPNILTTISCVETHVNDLKFQPVADRTDCGVAQRIQMGLARVGKPPLSAFKCDSELFIIPLTKQIIRKARYEFRRYRCAWRRNAA